MDRSPIGQLILRLVGYCGSAIRSIEPNGRLGDAEFVWLDSWLARSSRVPIGRTRWFNHLKRTENAADWLVCFVDLIDRTHW